MSDNLVLNDSFEDDGINSPTLISPVSNWTFSLSPAAMNAGETSTFDPVLAGPNFPPFGSHGAYLAIGTNGSLGIVSQVVPTVPGQTYIFGFQFSSDGAAANQFQALWNATTVMQANGTPYNPGWSTYNGSATYTFTETAVSNATTISFAGEGNGSSYVGVDGVFVMPMSTWTWFGGSGSGDNPANWTLTSGGGNSTNAPQPGDTAIVPSGDVLVGANPNLFSNTIEVASATLDFSGDLDTNFSSPSLDPNSVITTQVAGVSTPETTVLNSAGAFVNQGSILATGPAGSTTTIAISGSTVNGTFVPGYFFNSNLIEATAGNTLLISVGATSEVLNTGSIVADGGTVRIIAAASAIAGGYAPMRGSAVIEAGGTLETNVGYASTVSGTGPSYIFADSAAGNTLKIDNIGSFVGRISNFSAGDTIDLGTSLAVGTLAFSSATNFLTLENNAGGVLATLSLGGAFGSGTFAVTGGTADGFIIGTAADGDTVLTTSVANPVATGASGTWQTAASWAGGTVPSATDTPTIGQGASSNFTLTTGGSPVSVGGFSITSPQATVQITSDTTATSQLINDFSGTLVVAAGNTLTAGALQTYGPTSAVTIAAGATVALSGRLNPNIAPVAGTWTDQKGNNFAVNFAAGTAEIDGSLLAGPPTIAGGGGSTTIGYDSAGQPASVTVNSGGTVTDTHTTMGSGPSSFGMLTLNGAGASWTDAIDASDPLKSNGYILVGFDDITSNTPAGLVTPGSVAAAQVLIENGATLTDQEGGYIGDTANSGGIVTVTNGGLWNLASSGVGFAVVGQAGSGSLLVLNGGSVAIGATGTFLSNGTNFTAGGIGIGRSLGATGTLTVSGAGSQLSTLGGMSVGQQGQGLLDILNGGTVLISASGVSVGTTAAAGASGTIDVGGSGAAAALNFAAGSGGMSVGAGAFGTVDVTDNGTINLNGTGFLTIGSPVGSVGSVVVGGTAASAVINIGTAGLTVGNAGNGSLTVNALGTIALTGTAGILVGQSAGATGRMTVNGGVVTEGATTSGFTVGLSSGAAASLQITNNGMVSLAGGGMAIASGTGANGSVSLSGAGSTLKTSGTAGITVGGSGNGTLTVAAGGVVNDGNGLTVGANTSSHGLVSITGGGILASSINVGGNGGGTGTLAITGGTVTTGGILGIGIGTGSSGTVSISGAGAGLSAANIEVGEAGAGTLTIQGRTLSTGNLSLGGSPSAPLGNQNNLASATSSTDLAVTGALAIWHGSTLSLDATSAIDVGPSSSFVAGSINLESGHTIAGNGLIAAPIINNGVVDALSNTVGGAFGTIQLELQGSVTGTGTLALGANSTLRLDSSVAASQAINFGSGGVSAELILNSPGSGFSNAITGLWTGSKIEFGNGMTITSASVVSGNTIAVNFHNAGGTAGIYDLTNVSFAPGSGSNFSTGTDFQTGLGYIQVQASNFNWTGSFSTDYGTNANWQGGIVPNGADTASFGSTAGTVSGSGSALSINIGNYNGFNTGTWNFNNTTLAVGGAPNPPFLPFGVGFYMNTVLNGGTLNAAGGTTNISNINGVTVTAQGGATVTTAGDTIGSNSGQNGALVLTGASTTWTEQTGAAVNGTTPGYISVAGAGAFNGQAGSAGSLTVTAGALLTTQFSGSIAANTGSDGSATVSAGGRWLITGTGGLSVGSSGIGTLTVNNGTVSSAGFSSIGNNVGGQGAVTITAGGTLTDATGMTIGGSGSGTLVANGGTVSSGGFTGIGQNTGGFGTVAVSGGGVFSNSSGGFSVGGSGAGALTINNGTVTSTGFVGIGNNTGGIGSVSVSGAGHFDENGLTVGNSGDGTLTVSGSSEITDTGGLTVGNNAGALGIMNVTSATVSAAGNTIIGNNASSDGTLTIGTAGTIIANGTFDAVGNNAGSDGALVINSGGQLQVSGTLVDVGFNAGSTGSVIINAGGTLVFTAAPQVITTILKIGRSGPTTSQPGAVGTVLVTGAGAILNTNTNGVAVGDAGLGSLTVEQGGSVAVGSADSGIEYSLGIANSGGTGAVTVDGAGSVLTADGYLLDGRGGAGSLEIQNSGSLVVNDSMLNGSGIGIGAGRGAGPSSLANVGGNGVALVTSGGVLDLNSTTSGINVGGNGVNGALTVNNGGTVLAGTGLTVGTATTASGTIYGGTGELNIGAGGVVRVNNPLLTGYDITIGSANASIGGPSSAASGQAIVSGTGALLDGNGAGIAVGSLSSGSLLISQGGSAVSGTPDGGIFSALSIGREANGSVTVTDKGSTLTANGFAYVGRAGTGSLVIENQASLGIGLDGKGNGGLSIGGAGLGNGNPLYVGGTGTALVTSGGTVFSTQSIDVGENGVDGTLTVNNGGTVETGQSLLLGNTVTVAAGGTIISSSGTTVVASATAQTGYGLINVGPGGTLKVDGAGGGAPGTPTIVIGAGTGSSGDLNVSGAGALVSNAGGFQVGGAAYGSLTIQSGGTVITSPGTVAGLVGAEIGAGTGSDGSNANVTGNGSDWQIGGKLVIGDAAAGSLAITAGGTVTASDADIGVQASGSGNLSIAGAASNLMLTGQLTVGDGSSAELSILGGGMVSATNADIGLNAGSTGNVDIEGAGSHLDIANDLNIGDAGVGVLTLGNGTELTVGNNLVIGANGVLNQFGGSIDPSTITIVSGGRQGGHGTSTASVMISNAGTLFASAGTETVITPLITAPSGKSGVLEFDTGGNLLLNVTSVDATQSVTFTDSTGILTIGTIGGFAAPIVGVIAGDTIIVQGKSIASDSFNPSTHVLTLFDGSSATIGTLKLGPSVDGSAILANGTGGLGVAPCFAAGTRISTERGEVAVEDLRMGDRVQTVGSAPSQPVTWIGHRSVDCTRHPKPHLVHPVRVAIGAFGPGRPSRELWLSPDHAVYIGDVLIPVKYLINGASIAQVPMDQVTYFHVELPQHAVLLAENLPAESYLDTGDRSNFANSDGPVALYPDFASRVWDAEGCAPLVVTGPELEAAQRWVNGLAGQAARTATAA